MKKIFSLLFVVIMLLFVGVLAYYLPVSTQLRAGIEEAQAEYETGLQREKKQQHEYDDAIATLAETKAQLEIKAPQAASLTEEVDKLKNEKKKLRDTKKELEAALAASGKEDGSK